MKKLLIMFLMVTSLSLKAQEQFEGAWVSETSSYYTTILASEYKVLSVHNFSFYENQIITEKILFQNKNNFKTALYNPVNGYSVNIDYKMKHKDTLVCVFNGDLKRTVTLTRILKK
jgi:hypothetical protein